MASTDAAVAGAAPVVAGSTAPPPSTSEGVEAAFFEGAVSTKAAAPPQGEEHRLGTNWVRVFAYLDPVDLHAIACVCRHFHGLVRAHSQTIWKAVVMRAPWRHVSDKVRNWADYYALKSSETAAKWSKGEAVFTCLWGHTDSVCSLHFNDEFLVTGSMDKTIRLWDLYGEPRRCLGVLEGHESTVYQVRLHGRAILSCSGDRTLRVWDRSSLKLAMEPVNLGTPLYDIKTNDAHEVVVACHDGSTRFLDLRVPGLEVGRMTEHAKSVLCVDWDRDMYLVTCVSWTGTGSAPVTGSLDKTIRVWSWDTGKPLRKFEAHTESITAVQVHGRRMVTGSNDRTIRIWSLKTGKCLHVLGGYSGNVYALQFSDSLIVNGSVRTANVVDFEHREGAGPGPSSKE
eukprot:c16528_g1_i2.p1 GENE.c16528_g1_i2~~c16528_g1_i2.p1  ORF type:complete len:398 (+),score=48.54 c16528_g1_i2:132-1325(+)